MTSTHEEELPTRRRWITGLVLATAFVGTVVWSVAQDADDDRTQVVDEERGIETTIDPIDPDDLRDPIVPSPVTPTPLVVPEATLTVHTDGCGVIRSEVFPPVDDLGWSVKDADGFEVLNRNAQQEDRYRYFRPGTYTVVLESRGQEISNTVTITC